MRFHPIKEGQLILSQLGQDACHLVAFAKFFLHISDDFGDTGIVLMIVIGSEEIQLGILLDLSTEIVKLLDGSVAGKEILRTGAEGNDLEVADTDNASCNRYEFADHLSDLIGCADRILGNVSLDISQSQVVAGVEHTAVSIASGINKAFAALPLPRIIITTEKDAARLKSEKLLSNEVRINLYAQPIKVMFLEEGEKDFDQIVAHATK